MKHCVILGTRPEIIKLSPLIRSLIDRGEPFFVIHSNQHYSKEMDEIFFDELELPQPKYNLGVGSKSHAKQTAKILETIEDILEKEQPDVVYVQGDTNTVIGGALAASKMGIKIAHIEAGLRSYDHSMPEEINRVITDHISDYLFPPTEKSSAILEHEGISKEKIFVVGNTIVDAIIENLKISNKKRTILSDLKLKPGKYFLLTLHRPANVDSKKTLLNIIKGLTKIAEEYRLPIVFPVHPRTKKQIEKFSIRMPSIILQIDPVGFLEMLQLEQNAKLILTDSGGIQEEACILEKPCVTLRENTERPETLEVGGNYLAGSNPSSIFDCANKLLTKKIAWHNPFGDGQSSRKIISITTRKQ